MTRRIVLLVTSPRLPAGLLTAAAWDLLRAHPVYTAADGEQPNALRASGVPVRVIEAVSPKAMVPKWQVRIPLATGSQAPASEPLTAQSMPPGSSSVRVTPVESPLPPALTVMS